MTPERGIECPSCGLVSLSEREFEQMIWSPEPACCPKCGAEGMPFVDEELL